MKKITVSETDIITEKTTVIEREMTADEYAQYLKDEAIAQVNKAEAEEIERLRASRTAKLLALGLTEEEINA
jgi:hypothetical protein